MTVEDRLRWENRYRLRSAPTEADVALPAVFARFASLFPSAGHALDIACGQGTASVWLARRGLTAHGVDIAPAAIAQARMLAERCGVAARCRFEVHDLDDGLPAGPPADIIICHRFRDARLDSQVIDRLAPGGLLAISARRAVGTSTSPFRVAPGELTRAFGALTVVAAGETDTECWLLARKPTGVATGRTARW